MHMPRYLNLLPVSLEISKSQQHELATTHGAVENAIFRACLDRWDYAEMHFYGHHGFTHGILASTKHIPTVTITQKDQELKVFRLTFPLPLPPFESKRISF